MLSTCERTGYALVLLAVLIWSTAEVTVRTMTGLITPIQLNVLRFGLGGLALLLYLPFELRRKGLSTSVGVLRRAAWIALIGVVASGMTFQYGLQYAGASIVATVFGAAPIAVLLLSAALLGERITAAKLAGVFVGFAGVAVLASSEASETFSLLGLALAVAAMFAFAAFTVVVKRFAGPFAGLPITTYCFLIGAAMLVPGVLIEGDTTALHYLDRLWMPVLYLAIGNTGLAYLLYFVGLEHLEASRGVSLMLLKPPLAVLLAAAWLGEPIGWRLLVALVLILSGLYLVVLRNHSTAPVSQET